MAEVRIKEGEGGALAKRGAFEPLFEPLHAMNQLMQDMMDSFRPISPWLERAPLFQRWGRPYVRGFEGFAPAFDVKERSDAYVIEADLPGVKENDIDITLSGNRLSISGKRDESKKEENEAYYSYERQYGSFSRTFTLPADVNAAHVSADFDNGVLSVVAPKTEAQKPRKITLKERIKALKS